MVNAVIHILFLIRDLESGGAQRQLIELVKGLDKTHFRVTVVTFYEGGFFSHEVAADESVTMISLDKRGRWDNVGFLWRFWQLVCAMQPDILHGYMNLANLFCFLVGKATGTTVVWGLRSTTEGLDWMDRVAFRLCAVLSRFSDAIIVNSHTGNQYHVNHGYNPGRITVVPNGINTILFHPDNSTRQYLRRLIGLRLDSIIIGMVARYDPMKGHSTFLQAAHLLHHNQYPAQFVLIGEGMSPDNPELWHLVCHYDLEQHVHLLDKRRDVAQIISGFDIITLPSAFGEGFPNVIGEAMACGVPCVVTDIGDSASIVGETGVVIPPGSARALAAAWIIALAADTPDLREQRRQRIVEHFSVERMVQRTETVLLALHKRGTS